MLRVLSPLVCGFALAATGCAQPYVVPQQGTEDGEPETESSSESETETSAASTESDDEGPQPECQGDQDCPSTTPYCERSQCVDCTGIGHSGCYARDPQVPICDPALGWCVQCTPDIELACVGDTPVCAATGECVGCTSADQCEGFCDLPSGFCDAAPLRAQVFNWELVNEPGTPVDWFTIESEVFNSSVTPDPTGLVSFDEVEWSEEIRYEWRRNQLRPVSLSGSTTRVSWNTRFPESSDQIVHVPYLSKATAGRIAFECGLFESLDAATGELAGTIPSELHSRGILLVQLTDDMATPAPVDRTQIDFTLDEWPMSHGSEDPEGLLNPFVCDIVSDQGLRIGSPGESAVGSQGWFVIFGLRDASGNPIGPGSLNVPGYGNTEFTLSGWGEMGYLRLSPT